MESKYNYFKRDISWLSFNYRVLLEALDKDVTAELEKRHVIDHKVKQERMQYQEVLWRSCVVGVYPAAFGGRITLPVGRTWNGCAGSD